MRYIFFYRYGNGTEGFGFYENQSEATDRMNSFKKDSIDCESTVEFGIAGIEEVDSVGLNFED